MPDAAELRARLAAVKKEPEQETGPETSPAPSSNGSTPGEIRWQDDTRMQAVVDALIEQAVDRFASDMAKYFRNRTTRTLSPGMVADMIIAERARQKMHDRGVRLPDEK